MSGIIKAIFGHHKDEDEKKHHQNTTETVATVGTASGSSIAHTAISEDVRVQSVVSTETNTSVSVQNSKKIADLMNKLGTTHHQIDEYSKKRTAEISEAVSDAINKVVADTAAQQHKLLSDANERSVAIENEYKVRLQERIVQLDNEKAILLAELERALNERQEAILLKARQEIDMVQDAANREKMAVFKEAQARANQQVDQITEQVAELAAEDAQRRLQSTTQTVITTKAVASGETHTQGAHVTTTTTSRKSSESHHSSISN
ncbi:unnamed protein product [Adineta ricciae]|uniref:Uncharacterized protein n=1 Tax=Adineta ricciae TaxID=249248 RepID=A0A814HA42_ADIRI|nr:unnamed protein product [Adineta ricciae]CAF1444914.1 unnamed protein product [Adineta ricciae]